METVIKLDTAEAVTVLNKNIQMWLCEEKRAQQKKALCSVGSPEWFCRDADANRYFSMAEALFMAGREMGIVDEAQYPMLRMKGAEE